MISSITSSYRRPEIDPIDPDVDPTPPSDDPIPVPPPRHYPDTVIHGAELFVAGAPGELDGGLEIHYNDVMQGHVGNCDIMATAAAIALRNPEEIRNLFRANHNAKGEVISYTVTLWEKTGGFLGIGQKTVPREFNFSLPLEDRRDQARVADTTGGKQEVWPILLDRAYRQMDSAPGGDPADAFFALTGREASNHYNKLIFSDVHWPRLRAYLDAGQAVVLGSKDGDAVGPAGLKPNHAYVVLGRYQDDNDRTRVRLYNPHGYEEEVFADDLPLFFQSLTHQE